MHPLKFALAFVFLLAAAMLLAARWSREQLLPSTAAKPASEHLALAAGPDWETLSARATEAAVQWEARARDLEIQVASYVSEMDAGTRAAAKKAAPLPPAPRSKLVAKDDEARFWEADKLGKAWRERAVALEARLQAWQPRPDAQRARGTASSSPAPANGLLLRGGPAGGTLQERPVATAASAGMEWPVRLAGAATQAPR